MEELKKAEVAVYASGQEPDYAQNESDQIPIFLLHIISLLKK